jgi:AraC-like DNA-binding protein
MTQTIDEAARRVRLQTADPDRARDLISQEFAEHEMLLPEGHGVKFEIDLAHSQQMTLGRLTYGANTVLEAAPLSDYYNMNLPTTGRSAAVQNGVKRDTVAKEAGVMLVPSSPLTVEWSRDAVQYLVKLHRGRLEAHAAKLSGTRIHEELRFDLSFSMQSPSGQALLATTEFFFSELKRDGGIETMAPARYAIESSLMTQILMVIPSQLSHLLHAQTIRNRRSQVRDLIDLIHRNPAGPLTVADLAAHSGLSVRTLQLGFQEAVGMSPTTYVRSVRLDRAHHELLTGAGDTVTDIANRWGFYHAGRFAQQYRERFGCSPSATARQFPAAAIFVA